MKPARDYLHLVEPDEPSPVQPREILASADFLNRSRNVRLAEQALREPWRIERTEKGPNDVVI